MNNANRFFLDFEAAIFQRNKAEHLKTVIQYCSSITESTNIISLYYLTAVYFYTSNGKSGEVLGTKILDYNLATAFYLRKKSHSFLLCVAFFLVGWNPHPSISFWTSALHSRLLIKCSLAKSLHQLQTHPLGIWTVIWNAAKCVTEHFFAYHIIWYSQNMVLPILNK